MGREDRAMRAIKVNYALLLGPYEIECYTSQGQLMTHVITECNILMLARLVIP